MSSGFGEVTFLSFTTRYHKTTVGGWSSGTGNEGGGDEEEGGWVSGLVLVPFRMAAHMRVGNDVLAGCVPEEQCVEIKTLCVPFIGF